MALSQSSVIKLYNSVIDDVIANVRDSFLDEGVDEQVLQEMKQVWTNKLMASKAVEISIEPIEPQAPASAPVNNTAKTKANGTKSKPRSSVQREQTQQQAQQQQSEQQQQQQSGDNSTPIGRSNDNHTSEAPETKPFAQQQMKQNIQQPATSAQQQSVPAPPAVVAGLDPSKIVPIQITLPAQANVPNSEPRILTIQVPASALQENQLHQALTATPIITSIMSLPPALASTVLQKHIDSVLQNNAMQSIAIKKQLDGSADTSDEDGSDISDDNNDNDDDDEEDDIDKEDEDEADDIGAEEEPLNSDDDVSETEQTDLFDTDNVIVCQYDKITRSRNKWKFYLKDGIMNIGGKDYVFQKSNGDAEW